jgi:hypothetical protein
MNRRWLVLSFTAAWMMLSCGQPAQAPAPVDPNKSAFDNDPSGWTDILPKAGLAGWTKVPIPYDGVLDPKEQWAVQDGVLVIDGTGGHEWARYDAKQFNRFILHAEWRFRKVDTPEPRYNGGLYFWASADGRQFYQAQTAEAGGWLFGNLPKDGEYSRTNLRDQMTGNRMAPIGEWNTFEVHASPDEVKLWVNGDVQNRWPNPPATGGYLGLEAEGYSMEFRKLLVKELP